MIRHLNVEPTLVAKSTIVLDVKPWDDETNMEELEKSVRTIELDGLLWGACTYRPIIDCLTSVFFFSLVSAFRPVGLRYP